MGEPDNGMLCPQKQTPGTSLILFRKQLSNGCLLEGGTLFTAPFAEVSVLTAQYPKPAWGPPMRGGPLEIWADENRTEF